MKQFHYVLEVPANTATDYYFPVIEKCRLVRAVVVPNAVPGATRTAGVFKGATAVAPAVATNIAATAGTPAEIALSAVEADKKATFDVANPIKMSITCTNACKVGVILFLDDYVVGSK